MEGVLIVSAILAVPVNISAKLLKTNLNGFGFAFIASLLVVALQAALGFFVPTPWIGLPLSIVGSIFIFSVALGTSWPKAAVVFLIVFFTFVILGIAVVMVLGGKCAVTIYGHDFWFQR